MRVIVPYTAIRGETIGALAGEDFECVFVGRDDEAYWRLLVELWLAQDDFALVEHDLVAAPGVLDSFRECPRPWCCARYPYLRSDTYAGLGCTRFRAALMRQQPDLMYRVGERSDARHPKRHYCTIDAWIQRELGGIGRACVNHPAVGHLHRNPTHGCIDAQYLYVEAA